jgi:hypothetical protein
METRDRAVSSTIAVTIRSWKSDAKRFAPSPPNSPPSVATKNNVCAGLTMVAPEGTFPETEVAYERASSISAAIPEALSFAPGPVPTLSRCARTASAWGERPGIVTIRFSSRTRPRPGIVAVNGSRRTRSPRFATWSANHWRALAAPGEVGERSGKVCARSRASATARSLSNAGGRVGTAALSAGGLPTLKAAISSGIPTSSQVPR